VSGVSSIFQKSLIKTDLDPVFDNLVATIMESSLQHVVDGSGGSEGLSKPLKRNRTVRKNAAVTQ